MTIHHRGRAGIATAFVVALLATGTACGTEVSPPSQDIGGGDRTSPASPTVTVPPFDDRPCVSSPGVARREHRPVCAG